MDPPPPAAFADALAALGAPAAPLAAGEVEPMLAETAEAPFSRKGFLFELKLDGFRAIAGKDGPRVALHYRRGREASDAFPELVAALRALPAERCVLDGEICVLDEQGRPSFQRLQRRALRTRPRDLAIVAKESPAALLCFDLLAAEGRDLRGLPLLERKRLLRLLLPAEGPLACVDHLEEQGAALFARAKEAGLEGVMGKRADGPYRAGRSRDWLKVRVERTDDFAVVGFTRGDGGRAGLGALHLASAHGAGLVYAGSVGSGFTERQVEELRAALEPKRLAAPRCTGAAPTGAANVWVEPELVAEVRYKERTEEGLLRHPVFLRVRPDKGIPDLASASASASASVSASASAPSRVRFSNLAKPLWPAENITKGDLIAYYRAISPFLLPYLRDRAVTLTRYPDGIGGKSFFQKNAPEHTPDWVRVTAAEAERGEGHHQAVVCDELDALLWVANLASIPLHLPAARLSAPDRPDWCVIDLDPKGAPFAHVVRCALELRARCDDLELPLYCKTSGQAGLHLLVPLGGQASQEETKALGELLARLVESRLGDVSTIARPLDQRRGRVYLDFLQNGRGKTIAGPYSVRPVPGATVSTPLRWDEVHEGLDPRAFHLRSVPARLERLGQDLLAPVLTQRPDLPRALERLGALLSQA